MAEHSPSESFLSEFRRRQWQASPRSDGISPIGYYRPLPGVDIEVAFATAVRRPRLADAKRLWRERHGGRATGVLLVVAYPDDAGAEAVVVGPHDEARAERVPFAVAESAAATALEAATTREATGVLDALFAAPDDVLPPGLRNGGLFTSHSLVTTVPHRPWWDGARRQAAAVAGTRGEDLLRALGWHVIPTGRDLLLRDGDHPRAVAVLLELDEVFERPSLRLGLGLSPVDHALDVARAREVDWVLAVQGTAVRLYPADPSRAVARRGSSHVEVDVARLAPDDVGYAWALLSPAALRRGGTVDEILADSRDHAAGLGVRLRERVYVDVVPQLAETIARRSGDLTEQGLARAYHDTLVVLFRLLFVAYAEDRGLLPYRTNTVYTRASLRERARTFADRQARDAGDFDARATDLWENLLQIWDAVAKGNTDWGVPPYGGGLFRTDSPTGQAISGLHLTNAEIGPALAALLVDEGPDGERGPVDFRALSVREFGTIYEGLLESSLSLAPVDLTLDSRSTFVPAGPRDGVAVRAGAVYFHNASGARKASGSYFTKEFAVEHLLETALDPTVGEHLASIEALLDAGRESDAAAAFYDLRVADIAMGSGHFLVAAVDHIARDFEAFLVRRPIPLVVAELEDLRRAAVTGLENVGVTPDDADGPEVRQTDLLRRQVAKRCLYGVDINEVAVELARLAVWIHTFVPGLPMSDLSHGLVHGNSLTGIGALDEALEVLDPGSTRAAGVQSLFRADMERGLDAAEEPLTRAARLAEVTVDESRDAEAHRAEAARLLDPVRLAMDAAVAGRLGILDLRLVTTQGWEAVVAASDRPAVRELIERLHPLHFPVAFPEVFRAGRERPGFDVVLGNPPWEELTVEEDKFWGMHDPGLRSTHSTEHATRIESLRRARPDLVMAFEEAQERARTVREVLLSGVFPGMGTGDPDLYKAFAWRFWRVVRTGGRLGVVLPRSAFSTLGSSPWRNTVLLNAATSLVFIVNEREWAFTDVNPGWPIALVTVSRSSAEPALQVAGPFTDAASFARGVGAGLIGISVEDLLSVDPEMCVPPIGTVTGLELFGQLIKQPALGSDRPDFEVQPMAELHATNDGKKRFFTNRESDHPVYNHLNIGHFRFRPEDGAFNYVDWNVVVTELQRRRATGARRSDSAFRGLPPAVLADRSTLPACRPRVVFRDVVHASNPRKVWAALAPAGTLLTNKAPYLVFRKGALEAQAYVLGVLNSASCDWHGHLRVVLNLNFFILNSLPVPVFDPDDARCRRVAELAARLAIRDEGDYGEWRSYGDPITDEDERAEALSEMDAVVTLLYGVPDRLLPEIFDRPTRPSIDDVRRWRASWVAEDPR